MATVPPAPTPVFFGAITTSSIVTMFNSTGTGGSPVTQWQLGYGVDPSAPMAIMSSGGTVTVAPLAQGRTIYFWARGINAIGPGPWSGPTSATTLGTPAPVDPPPGDPPPDVTYGYSRIKVAGVWKTAIPYVKVAGVWKIAKPYVRVAGVWKQTS